MRIEGNSHPAVTILPLANESCAGQINTVVCGGNSGHSLQPSAGHSGMDVIDSEFSNLPGEMAEWLKAHAWKACLPQGNVGSNPTLSAIALLSSSFFP